MAEAKGQKRLESELERGRGICATTTRATQQVGGYLVVPTVPPPSPPGRALLFRANVLCSCAKLYVVEE